MYLQAKTGKVRRLYHTRDHHDLLKRHASQQPLKAAVFPRRTGGALAVFLTGKSSHTAVCSDLL
jgi:hypothetical protein